MNLFAEFNEITREDAPLAGLTWYRLGGRARWLIEPRSEAELSAVLARAADADVGVRYLGKGANLLVADDGVDDAVIRLSQPAFVRTDQGSDGALFAAAGANLMALCKATAEQGWNGLESLAGIPASIGGAIRMNCGGRYGEIGTLVRSVRLAHRDGRIEERSDVTFRYRRAEIGDALVIGATFELQKDDPRKTNERYHTIWREKTSSQPRLKDHSAGCMFKNPVGAAAGALIDQCGLKGMRCGGARVSEIHANFIVADEGATAADVLNLMRDVQARVEREKGIRLESEVEVWSRSGHDACDESVSRTRQRAAG